MLVTLNSPWPKAVLDAQISQTPSFHSLSWIVSIEKGEKDKVEKLFHDRAKRQFGTKMIHIKEKPNSKRFKSNR